MISGHGTIPQAIEATRLGAYDWLEKPLEKERVLLTVKNALMQQQLLMEKTYKIDETLNRFGMIGIDSTMQDVFKLIERVTATDATMLICGENGTGKELVARALYRNSRRAQAAFVHLNCAAIPDTLIESELFGHV
ncbi:sigma-54-dependent Fis family transcriptional regulator, partial [candidate division KSB1 bacterium]|nr:sigma-54-dependent Fis family transcriptional regulator [candidate division KSB1 bacterium]